MGATCTKSVEASTGDDDMVVEVNEQRPHSRALTPGTARRRRPNTSGLSPHDMMREFMAYEIPTVLSMSGGSSSSSEPSTTLGDVAEQQPVARPVRPATAIAPEIASYVASHGYGLDDEERIRNGAVIIANLTEHAAETRTAFGNADTRDALLAMAKKAGTDESILWTANVINNIVSEKDNLSLFTTAAVRDTLLHLLRRATNGHSIMCVCRAIARLTETPGSEGQRLFGTRTVRDTLVEVMEHHSFACDTVKWMCQVIANINVASEENQELWGTSAARDALVALIPTVKSSESTLSVARAIEKIISTRQWNVELYSIDDVRHGVMILGQSRPTTPEIMCTVSKVITRLCSWPGGIELFAHRDTCRLFASFAKYAENPEVVQWICGAMVNVTRGGHFVGIFANVATRQALATVSRYARTPEAAQSWCCAVNNLCHDDNAARLLAVPPMRHAFHEVGRSATTSTAVRWWCNALVSLTVLIDNKRLFATVSLRNALCHIGRRCTSAETVLWWSYALLSLAMDDACRRLFVHADVKSAFVHVAKGATEPEAVEALFNALSLVTIPEESTVDVELDEHGLIEHVGIHQVIEDTFANEDVRKAWLDVAFTVKDSDCASAMCSFLSNITNNARSAALFGTVSVRDALFSLGKRVASSEAARMWCNVVGNLTAWSVDNRPMFGTAAFRTVVLFVGGLCTNEESMQSFARAMIGIVTDGDNRRTYGSKSVVECIVRMAKMAEETETIRSLSQSIRLVASHDDNRKTLGSYPLRDALVFMSSKATSPGAVQELSGAIKIICVNVENKRTYATGGVRDALISMAHHATSSEAVRALCGALLHISMDDKGHRVLCSSRALGNAVALLDKAAQSPIARDAYETALRLFQPAKDNSMPRAVTDWKDRGLHVD